MSQILDYSEFSHWLRTLLNFYNCLVQEVLFFLCLLLLEHIYLKPKAESRGPQQVNKIKCSFKACSRKELKATLSAFLMESCLSSSVLQKGDKKPCSSKQCIWSQAQVITKEARVIIHNPQLAIGRCISMVMRWYRNSVLSSSYLIFNSDFSSMC